MRKKNPNIERSSVNSQVFDQLTSKRSNDRSSLTSEMTNSFNDAISLFTNLHSDPKSIPLAQWLKVCKHGSRYAEQVNEYRKTGNDKLKKSLPLISVGAVCEGGRKMENVIHRTGWISLDIDGKDNPHIKEAEQLRDEIANIVYVAFSGLSTGGNGVWALVKVEHPDKQEHYFEQLKRDFKFRDIILDKSKGKNPNDARFYSYDPGAIVNSNYKIYDRLPVKKERSSVKPLCFDQLTSNKYGLAALEDELNILSSVREGERNNQLFRSAAALANLVAGGVLDEYIVKDNFIAVARNIGLDNAEIQNTLNSAFNTGMKSPRVNCNHQPIKKGNAPPKHDQVSYPASWNEIEAPDPSTIEDVESVRAVIHDADPDELKLLKQNDSLIREIIELFDAEIVTNKYV